MTTKKNLMRIMLLLIALVYFDVFVYAASNQIENQKKGDYNKNTRLKIVDSKPSELCSYLIKNNEEVLSYRKDTEFFHYIEPKSIFGKMEKGAAFGMLNGEDASYMLFDINNDGVGDDIFLGKWFMSSRPVGFFYVFEHPYFFDKFIKTGYLKDNFGKEGGLTTLYSDHKYRFSSEELYENRKIHDVLFSKGSEWSGASRVLFFQYKSENYFIYYSVNDVDDIDDVDGVHDNEKSVGFYMVASLNKKFDVEPACFIKIY